MNHSVAALSEALICDGVRTPFGRYSGALAPVRADDLGAIPLRALMARHPNVDWRAVDDVIYGCANQAGEDNRNVARMSSLLAGLSEQVTGTTINRLCGSGMDAIAMAARAIKCGESSLMIAGGVESMSRAPFVMGKADSAYSRQAKLEDTTMGWRFINPLMGEQYGVDTMPETAENVAAQFDISRADQDAFALRSQQKTAAAQALNLFADELTPVEITRKKDIPLQIIQDEHPRATSLAALEKLKGVVRPDGSVTAGNASGINDGAAAVLLASRAAASQYGLRPLARVVATATSGVAPRIMGFAPALAIRKVLQMTGLTLDQMAILELNEAFAAQVLAVTRELGLADDDPRINPQGGAIALGHPLGASGARLVATAAWQLTHSGQRYALCSMCIGVGQGIAMIIERVERD